MINDSSARSVATKACYTFGSKVLDSLGPFVKSVSVVVVLLITLVNRQCKQIEDWFIFKENENEWA